MHPYTYSCITLGLFITTWHFCLSSKRKGLGSYSGKRVVKDKKSVHTKGPISNFILKGKQGSILIRK